MGGSTLETERDAKAQLSPTQKLSLDFKDPALWPEITDSIRLNIIENDWAHLMKILQEHETSSNHMKGLKFN